jgi:hypothetical protein
MGARKPGNEAGELGKERFVVKVSFDCRMNGVAGGEEDW